jgi:RecJ-like exonuclease
LLQRAKELADIIKKTDSIHIVTHIDADGLTAGAIALETIKRMGKNYSIEFVKQLDENVLNNLKNNQFELVWFTDLGSSIVKKKPDFPMIVTDHHACSKENNVSYHLNPHLFNIDGSYMLSGAGAAYYVSKSVDVNNIDLSALAIIGACGDLQNKRYQKLIGLNEKIIEDGKKHGIIKSFLDIQYFGRETRPVYKLLQYANDPIIPNITGRESSALEFLKNIKIPIKDNENWRKWVDLSNNERKKIISEIVKLLLIKGFGHEQTKRVLGEVYILTNEVEGTELHDAKEFATLLNSTARYEEFDVGLNVCLGDRGKFLKKARSLLMGHRHNLVEGLQFAKNEGIQQREYIQFFHAGNGIRDTIIGIVTNMLLNDAETRNDLPLIGFAVKSDSEIKASARATQRLIDKGLDLSIIIKKAAKEVEGVGGGHNIAAGATIPKGKEEEFLDIFERIVKDHLSSF